MTREYKFRGKRVDNDFGKAWFDEDGKAHASLFGEIVAWCEMPR